MSSYRRCGIFTGTAAEVTPVREVDWRRLERANRPITTGSEEVL
jgi:branched-subunit amino acid aminotransferase/4-amino-4-deoxychorismate lyase